MLNVDIHDIPKLEEMPVESVGPQSVLVREWENHSHGEGA
jgi:hypothetical protein